MKKAKVNRDYNIVSGFYNISEFFLLSTSLVDNVRIIPYQCPAEVSEHCATPLSLISLFKGCNILMEPFAVFIAVGTTVIRKLL